MKGKFIRSDPYQEDEMNLPVASVDEVIPFYETVMGFQVESRSESPVKSVILSRDDVKIGLAENGGDPTQDGCFFEVEDVEAAFAELKANGFEKDDPGYRVDALGDKSFKVFFIVAPDDLCYCLGEQVEGE